MPQGNCSLCGSFCTLTFEHVPPRAVFNKTTRYQSVLFEEILQSTNFLEGKFKGRIEQGGVGYYSLCTTCNSFLGLNYVNAYISYSNSFIGLAKKKDYSYFEFVMHHFEAAKVLKQIVSMFISLNTWQFSENYPELRNYVLRPENKNLPSRFRIFTYLNTEGQLRNNRFSVVGNFQSNQSILATELAFPPLGHVMTIDFEGTLPLLYEVTWFKEVAYDEQVSVEFKVNRLPTYSPFPLDYRTRETIESAINQHK